MCVSLLDPDMLKTIAAALLDFSELNCHAALLILLEVGDRRNTRIILTFTFLSLIL